MNRVLAGGVSSEGMTLLKTYLDKYLPDTKVEEINSTGIKGRVKNQGIKPEVALIILDTSLYQMCVGAADDVLSLPKCHKYEDDISLKQFLDASFKIVGSESETPESSSVITEEEDSSEDFLSASKIKKLKETIASRDATIINLRNRLKEISVDNEDYNTYIDKIAYLEEELKSLGKTGSSNVDSSITIKGLQTKIDNLTKELSIVRSEYDTYKEKHTKSNENDHFEVENNSLRIKITSLEEELAESRKLQNSLSEQVAELEKLKLELSSKSIDLQASDSEKSEIKENLNALSEKLEASEGERKRLESELTASKTDLKDLSDKLQSSENVVKTLTDEVSKASSSEQNKVTELNVELSKARDSISSLSTSIEDYKKLVREKEGTILELGTSISDKTEELKECESELASIKTELSKTVAQLEILNEKDYDNLLEKYNKTNSELSALQIRFKSIMEELASQVGLNNSYKAKIENLESTSVNASEFNKLKVLCKEQQDNLAEARDFVEDIKLSPFFLMTNYALAKVAMPLKLDVDYKFKKSKFVLLATSSGESAMSMYSVIKEQCSKSKKSFLLVDLVTESFIDSVLGLTSNVSPHSWLGGEDLAPCVADTKMQNVSAVTSGVGYINELFFLIVNWSTRLASLEGMADVILFNVGCLDSVVRYTMFNSFIDLCDDCNIFVKATPTNLRTTINHLSTLTNMGISKVILTDVAEKEISVGLYNKLKNKYSTEVYEGKTNLEW